MPQVAVKISEPIFAKLRRVAHQGQTTYADIIERALSDYEPAISEPTNPPITELQQIIDAALQPVLARLHALESLGLVKPLSPDQGIIVSVSPSALEGDLSANQVQGIVEAVSNKIVAEIAPGAAVDAIEREAAEASSSIPSHTPQSDKPRAFAEIPEEDKPYW